MVLPADDLDPGDAHRAAPGHGHVQVPQRHLLGFQHQGRLGPRRLAAVRQPDRPTLSVARAQGDGLMFDAIWTFQISEETE